MDKRWYKTAHCYQRAIKINLCVCVEKQRFTSKLRKHFSLLLNWVDNAALTHFDSLLYETHPGGSSKQPWWWRLMAPQWANRAPLPSSTHSHLWTVHSWIGTDTKRGTGGGGNIPTTNRKMRGSSWSATHSLGCRRTDTPPYNNQVHRTDYEICWHGKMDSKHWWTCI